MARGANKLTTKAVAAIKETGIYGDGAGLYLKVNVASDAVRRRWVFIYRFDDKRREMGLAEAANTDAWPSCGDVVCGRPELR